MKVEQELAKLGLKLPEPMPPVANYIGAVRVGSLLFVSGHGPRMDGKLMFQGKVGRDLTIEQGYAEDCFACTLAVLKDKRRGPTWAHEERCHGPAGLC